MKKKKWLALLLSAVMVVSMLPSVSLLGEAETPSCICKKKCSDGNIKWDCPFCSVSQSNADRCKGRISWTEAGGTKIENGEQFSAIFELPSSYLKYYYFPLEADIVSSGAVTVSADSDLVIDLNGHSISPKSASLSIFNVLGKLTIWDSAGGGRITGANLSACNCSGYFLMEGGTIENNFGALSGGVQISDGGVFEMKGGTIKSNHSFSNYGKDVTVQAGGTFIISGDAQILNCDIPNCSRPECVNGTRYNVYLQSAYLDDDDVLHRATMHANGGKIEGVVITDTLALLDSTGDSCTTFTKILNRGVIAGGTFQCPVQNSLIVDTSYIDSVSNVVYTPYSGIIYGGTFTQPVENEGVIAGGTFSQTLTNQEKGTIREGVFHSAVQNEGVLAGGTFNQTVTNQEKGTICDGVFHSTVQNDGLITGGIFYAGVTGSGTISESAYVTVTFCTETEALIPAQKLLRGGKAASPPAQSRDGYFFRGWMQNGVDYDFDTAVLENITLMAKWQEIGFSLSSTDTLVEGVDYTYVLGVLTVKTSKPLTIQNIDQSRPTSNIIVVAENVSANITLNGVHIDVSDSGYINPEDIEDFEVGKAAFEIKEGNGNVNLTLAARSLNILKGGALCAALQKDWFSASDTGSLGMLTIKGTGALECIGGENGAGIGGEDIAGTKNITIESGDITARGGYSAAGIGGGFFGKGKNITIAGGVVMAVGGSNPVDPAGGAGIGGGESNNGESITISSGRVTAIGGRGSAGLGGGSTGKGRDITITGGTITTLGGQGSGAFKTVPVLDEQNTWEISAGTGLDDLNVVEAPTDETYTTYSAVRLCDGVSAFERICMEITWTSMDFTYCDRTWDPISHQYIPEGWNSAGGTILLKNKGDLDITADFTFTPDGDSFFGCFTKDSFTVVAGGSDSTVFSISGKPGDAMQREALGAVTIKLAKDREKAEAAD